MPVPTSRTRDNANITIDSDLCNGCGLCVDVCKDLSLELKGDKAVPSQNSVFGCFACGHCMAVCPKDAIKIEGRTLSHDNLFPLPDKVLKANFDSLLSLLQRRRSVRDFKKNMIPPELIQKVLLAAECAPMGIPPSDVHVLVLETPEKVRAFSQDFCRSLEEMKWFTSGWFLKLMRPFWNKDTYLLFRDFVKPLVEKYTKSMKEGKNYITYDAPAACYFYGTSYADSADPVIPATYAMLAAESLGLGTCLIGGVHPFIQRGKGAAKFREKYKIRHKSKEGLILLMGYPKIKFRKGIRRTFAKVDYLHPSRAN